jgi:hypothetical protein
LQQSSQSSDTTNDDDLYEDYDGLLKDEVINR